MLVNWGKLTLTTVENRVQKKEDFPSFTCVRCPTKVLEKVLILLIWKFVGEFYFLE